MIRLGIFPRARPVLTIPNRNALLRIPGILNHRLQPSLTQKLAPTFSRHVFTSRFVESNPDDRYLEEVGHVFRGDRSYLGFMGRFMFTSVALSAVFLYSSVFAVLTATTVDSIAHLMQLYPAPVTAALVGVNVGLFALKRTVPFTAPFLVRFGYLRLDAMCTLRKVSSHVAPALAILGSTFSHRNGIHIMFNAYALYNLGSLIEASNGWPTILELYSVCIATGSIANLLLQRVHLPSLGASGVCMGMLSYLALCMPELQVSLFGIPYFSLSIQNGTLGIALWSVAALVRAWATKGRSLGNLDHAGHLGGLVGGVLLYLWQFNESVTR
ncbi:uncharacterized protein V1518DRAFT_414637 [Limtongia smithiae]|uniref:uncharacterized protein n=1 Tax=Limtongia smithiae TaxID=1125753 RepID=UPI0034CE3615